MTRPATLTPELILPAADLRRVKYAFMYGADACYGGLSEYSLRKAEVDFDLESLGAAIDYAHDYGGRFYVTVNIFPTSAQIDTLRSRIKELAALDPDAFIASDPGVISLISKLAPQIPIHLSTQANTLNYEAIDFWHNHGVKRVVLARELSLNDIAEISKRVPEVELECFVHGAMCISYSGRCLLSNVMTGRMSNQGTCTQPCRWRYREVLLEEAKRPGEYYPATQDEHGTYIMNSKDLCLIEHLDALKAAGVKGFKIEGRNKSEYYVAVVARAYRRAISLIDDRVLSEAEKAAERDRLRIEVETANHRGYTTGFLFGDALAGETYGASAPVRNYNYVGEVLEHMSAEGRSKISVKNKIVRGDLLELVTPGDVIHFKADELFNIEGEPVATASPGNSDAYVFTKLPVVPAGTLIRKSMITPASPV